MLLKKKKKSKKEAGKLEKEMPELDNEWLRNAPYKRLTNDTDSFLELIDGYGYMNILTIVGKDIESMGNAEIQNTLVGFQEWLTKFSQDFTIEATKLPTNVDSQILDLKKHLEDVRSLMKDERRERIMAQLQDRERILLDAIQNETEVKKQIYNAEYILYIYGENREKLREYTRKAKSYGGNDVQIKDVERYVKEQIIEQFNNMNEKL